MREIKFRTWQNGEMYFHKLQNYFGGSGIYNQYVGCDKAVWMQYTGLKDKNGKEIYEGDVITCTSKFLPQSLKNMVVVMEDAMFSAKNELIDSSLLLYGMTEIIVTGNIHEK